MKEKNNINNKPTVLFANFGRLEKNLFFQLDFSENFNIVAIVTDFSAKEIIKFLKYDSNHGKSTTDKFIVVNDKKTGVHIVYQGKTKMNIKILPSNLFNKTFVKNNSVDIIVDLSEKKVDEIKKLSKLESKVVILNNNKLYLNKIGKINCYGLENNEIDIKKNNVIKIPNIETTIIKLIENNLNLDLSHINFDIIKGPKTNMVMLDSIIDVKETPFEFSRSIFNNIIPSLDYENIISEIANLSENNENITYSGDVSLVPVTTGALMNITFYNKKSYNLIEFNKLIKEKVNGLIGYSEDELVSQDIVSTDFYGVINKNLIKIVNQKTTSILKIGIWFDYETSFIKSVFKTIQYIVGTSGFNK